MSDSNPPFLFFVALGIGLVFANLWIIFGIRYWNRRRRLRQWLLEHEGETPPEELLPESTWAGFGMQGGAVIIRPPRRKREKRLMTVEQLNTLFPLKTYKQCMDERASRGLQVQGGVSKDAALAVVAPVGEPEEVEEDELGAVRNADVSSSTGVTEELTDSSKADPFPDDSKKQLSATVTEISGESSQDYDHNKKLQSFVEIPSGPSLSQALNDNIAHNDQRKSASSVSLQEDSHLFEVPESHEEVGDVCSICIDDLLPNQMVRELTCGHVFHDECILPWLTKRRAYCPLCKKDYYQGPARGTTDDIDGFVNTSDATNGANGSGPDRPVRLVIRSNRFRSRGATPMFLQSSV